MTNIDLRPIPIETVALASYAISRIPEGRVPVWVVGFREHRGRISCIAFIRGLMHPFDGPGELIIGVGMMDALDDVSLPFTAEVVGEHVRRRYGDPDAEVPAQLTNAAIGFVNAVEATLRRSQ